MLNFKQLLLPIALGLLSTAIVAPAQAQLSASLTVQVEGLQDREGDICFKLFNGSQGFPSDNDRAVTRECVPITQLLSNTADQSLTYRFGNLPAGSYAVALYHDRNRNGQLDRGAFGLPTEGYGFSNNAPAVTGPARFQDAVFLVAGTTTIEIQMRYPQ